MDPDAPPFLMPQRFMFVPSDMPELEEVDLRTHGGDAMMIERTEFQNVEEERWRIREEERRRYLDDGFRGLFRDSDDEHERLYRRFDRRRHERRSLDSDDDDDDHRFRRQVVEKIQNRLKASKTIKFASVLNKVDASEVLGRLSLSDALHLAATCRDLSEVHISVLVAKLRPQLVTDRSIDLTSLKRHSRSRVSDAFVTTLLTAHPPMLRAINFRGCGKLTDDAIKTIAKTSSLMSLNVSHCRNLMDIKAIAAVKGLTSLDVSECRYLGDDAIKAIAANCQLTSLNVHRCRRLTDESIIEIAANCPKLTELNVGYCDALTDDAIKAIAANCPLLTFLDITACGKLTDASIILIAANCPELTSLSVSYCENITDDAIKAIAARRRVLEGKTVG